jgi:uncharacterized protein (DUF58 family)
MPIRFPTAAANDHVAGDETLAEVLADVRHLELEPGRLVTDVLAGGFRSTFRGGGVEFSDVREYVEGDDPRAVDWNVTARLGRPFVKRFVEERERTLVFVLDRGPAMAAGLGAWSPRQLASRFLACLATMAIANHDRVGLCVHGRDRVRWVVPKKGAGHVLRVLRDCVEGPAGDGGAGRGIDALLATVAGRLRRRAVVFAVSDFGGSEPLPALAGCARRHDVVAVRVLPRELRAPPAALLRVHDVVTARSTFVDFAAAPVRAAWQRRVQAWLARRAEQFGRAGVDVLDLDVPAAPDLDALRVPLARFFRARALREVRR